MNAETRELANLRLWLAAAPSPTLTEVLACLRDELATRLAFDASNYVTRAVAALDASRFARNVRSATTEPPASV